MCGFRIPLIINNNISLKLVFVEDEAIAAAGVGYFKCSDLPYTSLMAAVVEEDPEFKFKSTPYTEVVGMYQNY